MNYTRLLRESNKQWEVLSKNNGLVPLWSGKGRDGMVPTGLEGRWEKFNPTQRPKMTTHLWAGHVFPASDFWHLSTAHVLVVFVHFFIFMKLSKTKWMRAYRQTTLWSRGSAAESSMQTFNFEDKNGYRSYERQNINGHGRSANYQNHAWSYPNFATVLEQNLKLETVGLSDCIASYQESEAI